MQYIRADVSSLDAVASLALQLFPGEDIYALKAELNETLQDASRCIYICENEGKTVAFAEFSLRHDYVEGTKASPVGYVEAIFVLEEFRCKGAAKRLLQLGEEWAVKMGCCQMASDCELTNDISMEFHLKAGFSEANRIICFMKNI